ncbi:MAG: universal stress protein [Deltaproteobacteria bacterium]|nr:universal stress protein [Deltaproteobacteria bacterium]
MKILVGYKGMDVGKDLMDVAVKQAKAFEGEILIVTSLVGGESSEASEVQEVVAAEKNLKQAKAYFDDYGIKSQTHLLVRGFEAGEDIVKFAEEKNVDEIIIGVRSRSKVGKLIFGSTAQIVILDAHCPVLTVK